jgi:hypothetical protein
MVFKNELSHLFSKFCTVLALPLVFVELDPKYANSFQSYYYIGRAQCNFKLGNIIKAQPYVPIVIF